MLSVELKVSCCLAQSSAFSGNSMLWVRVVFGLFTNSPAGNGLESRGQVKDLKDQSKCR